jgi:hypothetical protein
LDGFLITSSAGQRKTADRFLKITLQQIWEEIMKKRSITTSVALWAVTMLMMLSFGCGGSSDSNGNGSNNSSNSTIISETTTKSSLTITDGEMLAAPTGYSLTMTVDGVETPMNAGTYTGNIVLTVTKEISVTYGTLDPVDWRTAVYVEDGAYVADKSVAAAWGGGTVNDSTATDLDLTSVGENFNGIVVTGDSTYTIENPDISFTGNGGNDFSGYGAAIVSKGNSNVTVNNAHIVNTGVVRTSIFAGGASTMTVNDSYIEVHNGTLPSDYVTNTTLGKMKEVPWMLGLVGNCRATNLVGTAKAYYNRDTIIAEGWGCLSTDDNSGVTLVATDCTIKTLTSGYGAYSIGNGTSDTFSGCTIDVADMAMIMANGTASGIFTKSADNITQVTSGRFGVVVHASNIGTLTINEGTKFNTDEAVILVKTASPTIVVDNATLTSGTGIVLQTMNNDDPNMSGSAPSTVLNATFSNMQGEKAMNGDLVNAMNGTVNITFKNAAITGAITTATAAAVGTINQATYYNIGEVTNTYETTGYGMTVSLDANSTWVVDKTSYMTGLTIADGASITALDGYSLSMSVDGVTKTISTGTYTGKIVLLVTAN